MTARPPLKLRVTVSTEDVVAVARLLGRDPDEVPPGPHSSPAVDKKVGEWIEVVLRVAFYAARWEQYKKCPTTIALPHPLILPRGYPPRIPDGPIQSVPGSMQAGGAAGKKG